MALSAATFGKSERIVSRKLIETLFDRNNAHSIVAFPLRAVFMEVERAEGGEPVQVLVSVSKRRFRRAVKRNRVKRQVREAYRLQKQQVCSCVSADKTLLLAFVWLADELCSSRRVANSVKTLLHKVAERQ